MSAPTSNGLSFGLSVAKAGKKKGAGLKKRPMTMSSAFGADDSESDKEEEERGSKLTYRERVNKELQEKAAISQAKMQDIQSKLESGGADDEEMDIYDYDGFASEKQRRVEQTKEAKKVEKEHDASKPQYIGNLMATAKVREKERELVHDKKVIKEREVEDQLYGDKPKFVTSAYRTKLEEDKKFEEAVAAKEARDDASQQQGLGSFLKNMYDGGGNASGIPKNPSIETTAKADARVQSRGVEWKESAGMGAEAAGKRGSAREDKWTQEVEEARGRYFLRKAAREAKGCWDL